MGMARLFFHNPKFGVLDECTNATSVDIEEHLYRYGHWPLPTHAADSALSSLHITACPSAVHA